MYSNCQQVSTVGIMTSILQKESKGRQMKQFASGHIPTQLVPSSVQPQSADAGPRSSECSSLEVQALQSSGEAHCLQDFSEEFPIPLLLFNSHVQSSKPSTLRFESSNGIKGIKTHLMQHYMRLPHNLWRRWRCSTLQLAYLGGPQM